MTEIILSQLGTPREPYEDLLILGVLAGTGAVYMLFEYGLGRLLARLFRLARGATLRKDNPPLD